MTDRAATALLQVMGAIELFALPRALNGLTDEEFFWEPSQPCWSVRRRGQAIAADALGAGEWVLDYDTTLAAGPPNAQMRTSIAWNLAHIAGIPARLIAMDFLGGAADPSQEQPVDVPGSASEARDMLLSGWPLLRERLASAGDEALDRTWQWAFGQTVGYEHVALMLSEIGHHLAYVGALRDAYAAARQG